MRESTFKSSKIIQLILYLHDKHVWIFQAIANAYKATCSKIKVDNSGCVLRLLSLILPPYSRSCGILSISLSKSLCYAPSKGNLEWTSSLSNTGWYFPRKLWSWMCTDNRVCSIISLNYTRRLNVKWLSLTRTCDSIGGLVKLQLKLVHRWVIRFHGQHRARSLVHAQSSVDIRAPFYNHGLNLIPPWISNHMSCNVWEEITYPFLNFNGCTVEV